MGRHVRRGGVLAVEPWQLPEPLQAGQIEARLVESQGLKATRMSINSVEDGLLVYDYHYLVARSTGIEHFVDRREYGLFFLGDYVAAFGASGLEVEYLPEGLAGSGLFIASRPMAAAGEQAPVESAVCIAG